MRRSIIAFATGLLFGLGLCVSEMIDPARVIGFLDVTGQWDPTLVFVMGGAVMITGILFPWVLKRSTPVCEHSFHLPTKTRLDASLLGGAALFGIGWGIAGLCPGPAIAALATGSRSILVFVVAMIAGQLLVWGWQSRYPPVSKEAVRNELRS